MADSTRTLVWRGLDAWRAEHAEVDLAEHRLSARGVQIGVEPGPYRLDYELQTGDGFVTERLQGAGIARQRRDGESDIASRRADGRAGSPRL